MAIGVDILLTNVGVDFGGRRALADVTLLISAGERVAIVGESGAGKSTLLNVIAGLLHPSHGSVAFAGRQVHRDSSTERGVSLLFQSDALFPHLTAAENVAFPLEARYTPRNEVSQRVHELLDLVGLGERRASLPSQLSGGERQRVALARALAVRPAVILLDEPFASLDVPLRRRLRDLVISLQEREGFTTITVTHDPEEAAQIGHKVAVIRQGRVLAFARASDLYWNPPHQYVAELLGVCDVLDIDKARGLGMPEVSGATDSVAARRVVMVRPELVNICASTRPVVRGRSLPGHVVQTRDLGRTVLIRVAVEDETVITGYADSDMGIPVVGSVVDVEIDWRRARYVEAE